MTTSIDEIVMQLHDKATFLQGVTALKKNLTGPPSAIFTVPAVWPAVVTLSTYISAKMKDETLGLTLQVLNVVDDLYALSPEQRASLARYKDAVLSATEARKQKKAVPVASAAAPTMPRPAVKTPHGQRANNGGNSGGKKHGGNQQLVKPLVARERPPTTDLVPPTDEHKNREAEARAARQAALFTKHDIAREEVKAVLGHHPLRVLGQTLSDNDAREALFGSGDQLRVGQVVAVARSKGGLCYGEVQGPTVGTKCFLHPKVAHPDQLIRVHYGSQHKAVSPALLGRLSQFPSTEPVLEPDHKDRPAVGDFVPSADMAQLQLGPGINFISGELAAVPRSSGGFTIGRVLGPHATRCPVSPTHNVVAWRVLADEADDESEGKTKLVPCGLLGRILSPWASEMRLQLEKEPRPKHISSAGSSVSSAVGGGEDFEADLNVEDKLRERFGDFTPFLDDDEDDGGGSHSNHFLLGPLEDEPLEEDEALEDEPLEGGAASLPATWTSEPLFG